MPRTEKTPQYSFRFPPEVIALIDRIAAHHGGLSRTQVLINAVQAAAERLFDDEPARPRKSR